MAIILFLLSVLVVASNGYRHGSYYFHQRDHNHGERVSAQTCKTSSGERCPCIPIDECMASKKNESKLQRCGFTLTSWHMTLKVLCPEVDEGAEYVTKPQGMDVKDVCTLTQYPPNPETQCCGVDSTSNNQIVGGNMTDVEQYPWLALIEYFNKTEKRTKLLCGGSLISGKYVLTAAHCITGNILDSGTPSVVRLGEYDHKNEGQDCVINAVGVRTCTDGAVRIPIEHTVVHPEYFRNRTTSINDIALIGLQQMVTYTNFIRPICLPTSDLATNPSTNFRLYTAGWGAIEQRPAIELGIKTVAYTYGSLKRHVDVPYRDITVCKKLWGDFVGKGHLCAGGETGKDSCRGDSGGPLMYDRGGIFEAVGVVSFGLKWCGSPNISAVYTNVYEHNAWIRSQIRK